MIKEHNGWKEDSKKKMKSELKHYEAVFKIQN